MNTLKNLLTNLYSAIRCLVEVLGYLMTFITAPLGSEKTPEIVEPSRLLSIPVVGGCIIDMYA